MNAREYIAINGRLDGFTMLGIPSVDGRGLVLNRDAFRNVGEAAITYCNNPDDDFEGNKMKFTTAASTYKLLLYPTPFFI